MKKFLIVAISAVLANSLFFGNIMAQDQPASDPMEKGVKQLYAEDYQGAISNFQKAIENDSNDGIAHYYLGYAYSFVNEASKAKENLQKAKELFNSQGNEEGVKAAEGILETLETDN
jgi:tetratricopeptide (TPR) repeat protein